ncbi:MAG: protease modulator HflC [Spirochaetales bacterium]|nr:protease modulator HflC [Spirochaetales bacterium]
MRKGVVILVIIVIAFILLFAAGPFYILEEGEQAVVTRFGAIVTVDTEAGLKIKLPMVDTVTKYSKKIVSWDGEAQRIPTAENQFIWVDTTARWRIADPAKFYESVTTLNNAFSRMDDIIDSSVRTVIAENLLKEAVRNTNYINEKNEAIVAAEISPNKANVAQVMASDEELKIYETVDKGRELLSEDMFTKASAIMPQFGIVLEDIVIRQIRYSDDLTQSVYNRMITERNQVAQRYRSTGEGLKAEWLGKLENEQRSVLSQAYETSEEIKGRADAEATRIYAEATGRDPEFYEFWRSIESYRKTLPEFSKTLSTNMDYFQYLYQKEGTE